MSRRRAAEKRKVSADYKFKEISVSRFINSLMRDGKKSVAENAFYKAVEKLEGKVEGENGIEIFKAALENVKPTLEVKSRRVGGSTYQIPVEVRDNRKLALAIRWMINASRNRQEKSIEECLASEFIDAYHKRGAAIKKKEETHKMAEANKAFAHYAW